MGENLNSLAGTLPQDPNTSPHFPRDNMNLSPDYYSVMVGYPESGMEILGLLFK